MLTIEVPHLLRLIEDTQFDTIYHEHFSYFSLLAARDVLGADGLRVFDVEELPTHGGSLRIWPRARTADGLAETAAVERVLRRRAGGGPGLARGLRAFAPRVERLLARPARFLVDAPAAGRASPPTAPRPRATRCSTTAASRPTSRLRRRPQPAQAGPLPAGLAPADPRRRTTSPSDRPDYLLMLPWNLRDEIIAQMADVREWGCRFVVPVPRLEVLP